MLLLSTDVEWVVEPSLDHRTMAMLRLPSTRSRTRKGWDIAHSKVERFEDSESSPYDRYSPRLHKHTAALMREWSDAVLFATRKMRTQSEDAGFNRKRTIAHAIGKGGGERKWVTDVKYVRTSAGWMYLAPVLDRFSRRIVGCAMSTVQDGDLSVSALASAMRARGSPRGVLVHSDGGGIYGDEECLKKLEEHGVKRSMSRKKNPWDNAVIESFFSTLRFELLGRTRFADPDEAERGISEWIERFNNLYRRHTTLGNVRPINYELAGQMRKQRTYSTCRRNRGRLKACRL